MVFIFLFLKKTLEEKKSVLEDAKSAERLALQSFQEKTTMVEVFTKVIYCELPC